MAGYTDEDYDYSLTGSEDEGSEGVSDDDGIAMDQDGAPRGPGPDPAALDCTVLTTEELANDMHEIISEVAMILRIEEGKCRSLLRQFKWNKESLLERFYECADTDSFLRSRHVAPKVVAPRPSSSGECENCLMNGSLSGMECNHWYCHNCWEKYLESKIVSNNCSEIECMKCELLICDERVLCHLNSEPLRKAYRRLTTDSFVESNRLLKWCPAPDCGRAIKVSHCEPRPVVCSCGMRFCFSCAHEWHEPVNCRLLKLWLKKCSDDSETSNWINANTKECPKCQVTIEKDGGCNHMTCKNTACKMEFCWMCLGPWEPHGSSWYACNRYDDSAAKDARDAQEKSRAALQRYLHYYNRYMNHQQSLKLENKLYATVKSKMEQMQQQGMSWIEVQFLKKAVDVLSECRRTLMYTYAFAYYLNRDNQAFIFEENQRDLEMATEQLSEFLEKDLENENLITLKQKVQDKFRYVDHRRHVLLRHCSEGTEKDMWKFTA